MKFVLLTTVLFLVCHQTLVVEATFCKSNGANYLYFGTKTFYKDVKGTLPPISARPAGCAPIFINMIVRHGARYPAKRVVPTFHKLFELAKTLNSTGKAAMCESELQELRDWKVWTNIQNDQNQTAFGDEEVRQVARNFQERFPELLWKTRGHDRFKFTSTDTARTSRSLRVFVEELFCNKQQPLPSSLELKVTPKSRDPLLRESCPKFLSEVKNNPNASIEYRKLLQDPIIRRIRINVANRLGVEHARLTSDVLVKIYDACYYQRWVETVPGPWCKLFTTNDMTMLDYATDVYNYPQRGFQFPITTQKNCFHTKEIINSLKLASEFDQQGRDYLLARVRVGHVFNVITLAANMGLYKVDTPPLANNFRFQQNRFFRISRMIPSAGNLAFVLYKCGLSDKSSGCPKTSDYKVQIFWNERLVKTNPACTGADADPAYACSLDKMLNYYEQFIAGSSNECNQDELCNV